MIKHIILLSGLLETRQQLLQIANSVLAADSNSVYADIISIEDFARGDMKAAYSDLKKQYKRALHSSRSIIVINIPADTVNAWQPYVDIALMEPMMSFNFHTLDAGEDRREPRVKGMGLTKHTHVSIDNIEDILRNISHGVI